MKVPPSRTPPFSWTDSHIKRRNNTTSISFKRAKMVTLDDGQMLETASDQTLITKAILFQK